MHSKCQQLLNCFALYFVFCERNIKYFNILFDAMVKIYLMVTFRFRINHSEKRESGKIGIIDGVQRLSTIRDFIDNKFALGKFFERVKINNNEYEIAGKRFKKLDEKVQEELVNAELQVYELIDCTDKEVREMFARQNSGKPLSSTNRRSVLENQKVSETINSLASHKFFTKIVTKAQSKSDLEKDIVRQALMIISDYDMSSFRSNDINKFVIWLNDNLDDLITKQLKDALDKLNAAFPEFV